MQILPQMYVVKMGIFNNTVATQGSSAANTFYLQIDSLKEDMDKKGSSCFTNQRVTLQGHLKMKTEMKG